MNETIYLCAQHAMLYDYMANALNYERHPIIGRGTFFLSDLVDTQPVHRCQSTQYFGSFIPCNIGAYEWRPTLEMPRLEKTNA